MSQEIQGNARRWGEAAGYYLPTALVFVSVLVLWELVVRALNIQEFVLPAPSAILAAFWGNLPELVRITQYTLTEALGGFLIGCSAGIVVALITARWTAAREGLLPFAIAANSTPIIAFSPIMNNWFGVTSPLSKMMIVAVITFFPMMINAMRGLTEIDPNALELMRSYAASEFEVLFKLRLPNSLPYISNALKVCSTLSLIGAVVGEFFGGERQALGVFITQEAALFRFQNAWAAIIIASAVGIAFYLLILLLERVLLFWHPSVRGAQ